MAGGIAATVASGGALAPALLGGAGAVAGLANHQVERSGNLGSNAGAMGVKKPYLIITRNKPYNPLNYNVYRGYPANTTVKLSNCTGYTEIEEVHLSGFNATQTEKTEIESLLKGGIIL